MPKTYTASEFVPSTSPLTVTEYILLGDLAATAFVPSEGMFYTASRFIGLRTNVSEYAALSLPVPDFIDVLKGCVAAVPKPATPVFDEYDESDSSGCQVCAGAEH